MSSAASVISALKIKGTGYTGLVDSQDLEVRSEMHVKMAQIDYPIRRAESFRLAL